MKDPQLTSKYIPQYKPGTQVNFSSFPHSKLPEVTQQEAATALRILVDFMKTETLKSGDFKFEPLLT